jgi:hypothetical protein
MVYERECWLNRFAQKIMVNLIQEYAVKSNVNENFKKKMKNYIFLKKRLNNLLTISFSKKSFHPLSIIYKPTT